MKPLVCTTCQISKSIEDYSYRSISKGIRHRVCKMCHKIVARQDYIKNKETRSLQTNTWVKNNPTRRRAISTEHASRIRTTNFCTCCTRNDLLTFYENCPSGYVVDHILRLSDEGLHCINNLQYLTPQDHGRKSGLEGWENKPRCERVMNTKLTIEEVCIIYELKNKVSGVQLAKCYNVSHSVIYDIWNKKKWGWIHD